MNLKPTLLSAAAALFITSSPARAQLVTTLAGVGTDPAVQWGYSGDGGRATLATLNIPFDVALATNGDLYFTDKLNHRIRRISASGTITTIAGTGTQGSSGDGGPATAATLNNPAAIAFDPAGNIYFSDNGTRIRRIVSSTGVIQTIAGTGTAGFSGDGGMATDATFNAASDVVIGTGGVIFIADAGNHRIRAVQPITGIINTVAGNGTSGFAGDGGAATAASLAFPFSVLQDATGNLFIADGNNKRIRRVDAQGVITTVAGDGSNNYANSGPALSIGLRTVTDLVAGPGGSIYFAEQQFPSPGSKLRSLSAGTVSNVLLGATFGGYGHGGPLTTAGINSMRGFCTDASGNLYLADPDDSRIVMLCNNPALPADSATYVKPIQPDNAANPFTAMERCNVICALGRPTGAPGSEIHFRTKVAPTMPMLAGRPFANRYYDIQAPTAPTAKGKPTFYFSQTDFNAYNAAATPGYTLLPTGGSDVAGRANVVVMRFGGTGTTPGNYTGTTTILTPALADVLYNPIAARWEVTTDSTELGGFYLSTKPGNVNSVLKTAVAENSLRVHPTLTDGLVSVAYTGASSAWVDVLDATSRRVRVLRVERGSQTLDVSALPAGLYMLKAAGAAPVRIVKR